MKKKRFSFGWLMVPLFAVGVGACASASDSDASSSDEIVSRSCTGPEGPAAQSPYDAPPRCEMRPILVDGQLTTDDERALWCEYGACGRSGEASCRLVDEQVIARTFVECDSGAVKCQRCGFRQIECGTTQGCVEHDACYDERLRNNEADSFSLFMALRAYCDAPIAAEYPFSEWSAWMQGEPGPSGFEFFLPYQEGLGCEVSDGACQLKRRSRSRPSLESWVWLLGLLTISSSWPRLHLFVQAWLTTSPGGSADTTAGPLSFL
jgi:hypothetical protein